MKNARTWCVWLAVVVSLTTWVSCIKETGNLPNYDLSRPYYGSLPLTVDWSWTKKYDKQSFRKPKLLTFNNGVAYIELNELEILAFDVINQKEKWITQLDLSKIPFRYEMNFVFTETDMFLYDHVRISRIQLETGQVVFDSDVFEYIPTGRDLVNAVFMDGEFYFLASLDMDIPASVQIWKFNPDSRTINSLWVSDTLLNVVDLAPMVADESQGLIHFVHNTIDAGTYRHFLGTLGVSNGDFVSIPFDGPNFLPREIRSRYFKYANHVIGDFGKNRKVAALDVNTGKILWEVDGDYWKMNEGDLYVSGPDMGRINPLTGTVQWMAEIRRTDVENMAFRKNRPMVMIASQEKLDCKDMADGQSLMIWDLSRVVPNGKDIDHVVYDEITDRFITLSQPASDEIAIHSIRFPFN
jgi:outer membrane protein assembly factor BamB